MKVVRWLGAYGKKGDLETSLLFELARPATYEVAAELVSGHSKIRHARVGLLIRRKAVRKKYKGDVWSVKEKDGKLRRTRRPVGTHTECFCVPEYVAIVIDGDINGGYDVVMRIANKFNLNVEKIHSSGEWIPAKWQTK